MKSQNKFNIIAREVCEELNYEILGFVNKGGFKETYKIKSSDGIYFALKIFDPNSDPERSLREIEAMTACDNPYIAKVVTCGTFSHISGDYLYIIEDFCEGDTLQKRLSNNHTLDEKTTFDIGNKLVDAIICLGEKNYVHRDIKPSNILFVDSTYQYPKLTDFGIVRMLDEESLTATYFASGPGTIGFASPEQMNNEKGLIDWRTDQFSLGIVLALCHFGLHPYGNDPIQKMFSREKPTQDFINVVRNSNLKVIEKMIQPWPSYRYHNPNKLKYDWGSQLEE